MKAVKLLKTALSTVASVGAGAIVGNIVCATMPAGTGLLMRGAIKVGAYALSNVAANAASKQLELEIDEIVEVAKTAVKTENEGKEDEET